MEKSGASKKVKNGQSANKDAKTSGTQNKKENDLSSTKKQTNNSTVQNDKVVNKSVLTTNYVQPENISPMPNQKFSVANRVKQVFFREQDSPTSSVSCPPLENSPRTNSPTLFKTSLPYESRNNRPVSVCIDSDMHSNSHEITNNKGDNTNTNPPQSNVLKQLDEKSLNVPYNTSTLPLPKDRSMKSWKHSSRFESNNTKEKRAKSPRFTLIDRLRHRSGGTSVSTSDIFIESQRRPSVPPDDPSVLPEALPAGHQLHFATHALKACKEPHKKHASDAPILCEHHGSENLQRNKKLVASLRSQLSHSLTTSATDLLMKMPPPADMSNRLEQVLTMEMEKDQNIKRSGKGSPMTPYSPASAVTRIAESDKYVMLARNPPPTADGSEEANLMASNKLSNNSAFFRFFCNSTCYDLMPDNSRLVALDSKLSIGKSFRALISNGIRAAPIWDSSKFEFVGMLTLTDFILILLHYHNMPTSLDETTTTTATTDEGDSVTLVSSSPPQKSAFDDPDLMLEKGSIEFWLRKIHGVNYDKHVVMHSLAPWQSLLTALRVLCQHKIHRLPVMNPLTGNLHFVITHKRLLAYLHMRFHALQQSPHTLWRVSLEESCLGTWDDLLCATEDQRLLDVLQAMLHRRVSAVPVVDSLESRKLIHVFSKFDFFYVASTLSYKCGDTTIGEALKLRRKNHSLPKPTHTLYTCLKTDILLDIMERLVHFEVHRLIVVDSMISMTVLGIVTVSDLLNGFMLSTRRASAPDTTTQCQ